MGVDSVWRRLRLILTHLIVVGLAIHVRIVRVERSLVDVLIVVVR